MWVGIFVALITVVIGNNSEDLRLLKKHNDFESERLPELKLNFPLKCLSVKKCGNTLSLHSNIHTIRSVKQAIKYNPSRGLHTHSHAQEESSMNSDELTSTQFKVNAPVKRETTNSQNNVQKSMYLPNYSIGLLSGLPENRMNIQSPSYVLSTDYDSILHHQNTEILEKKTYSLPLKYEQNTNGIFFNGNSDHSAISNLRDIGDKKSSNEFFYRRPENQQYHIELTNQDHSHNSKKNELQNTRNNQPLELNEPRPPELSTPYPAPYTSPSKYESFNVTPKHIKAYNVQAQPQAYAEAQAQAQAEAQALEFQKVSYSAHLEHQRAALDQIRSGIERHNQQSALEQINQGHLSDAGKEYVKKNFHVSDPQSIHEAQLTSRISEKVAETRKNQEAIEYKAHSDAILALQKQQAAHLKAQEDAHIFALNFEQNQVNAQARAQALANAQAAILYKAHRAAHLKAQNEAKLVAHAQANARIQDPENTPVIQYLLPQKQSFPKLNSQFS